MGAEPYLRRVEFVLGRPVSPAAVLKPAEVGITVVFMLLDDGALEGFPPGGPISPAEVMSFVLGAFSIRFMVFDEAS